MKLTPLLLVGILITVPVFCFGAPSGDSVAPVEPELDDESNLTPMQLRQRRSRIKYIRTLKPAGRKVEARMVFKREAPAASDGEIVANEPVSTFISRWNQKQEGIAKLKELAKLHKPYKTSPGIYDSFLQKWLSSYSNGPIDNRLYKLDLGPSLRHGYPLSKSHPQRPAMALTGYYKQFNVGGETS